MIESSHFALLLLITINFIKFVRLNKRLDEIEKRLEGLNCSIEHLKISHYSYRYDEAVNGSGKNYYESRISRH